jgi:hypothetical protein
VDGERLVLDDESPEALYELFEARGWGDGLPLVAPTPARVEAMLAACAGKDPDEVLAVLEPRFGECTRRMVAVNAVLAGCPPEVMPVLVSAVRALTRPELNLRGVNATTHPVAPLLIVHGDIAATAGFNAGLGAFGPGNRANATTGRALRLLLLHVAGARPGSGDASCQGQPSKYSYCVAENLAASPWESYARSIGVDSPSAVTVACGENPHNAHDMDADRPGPILEKLASVMTTLGHNNAPVSRAEWFVGLCPEHAATIAGAGWTRSDVQTFLYERARMPYRQIRGHHGPRGWSPSIRELVASRSITDDTPIPMTAHPDNIRVFVVGGAGKHSCVIPSFGATASVTLPVEP